VHCAGGAGRSSCLFLWAFAVASWLSKHLEPNRKKKRGGGKTKTHQLFVKLVG